MQDLPGFLIAGVALVGSPGPATLSIAAAGAAYGSRRGAVYMSGVVAGLVVVMTVTASGVAAALWALPGAAPILTGVAVVYFIWLAWRIASAPPLDDTTSRRRPPTFLAGVMLSFVNPKGYAAMAAVFSGFVLIGDSLLADTSAKMAILLAIILAVDIAWLFAGAALTRHFRQPRSNRAINIGFAIVLLASVAATIAL